MTLRWVYVSDKFFSCLGALLDAIPLVPNWNKDVFHHMFKDWP